MDKQKDKRETQDKKHKRENENRENYELHYQRGICNSWMDGS
jgi:hypothetical protein